ncbi:PilZ domain-containing protein [Spirochaeta cellobiosiphila]|uniref:PilZ domain-containing protein n=1 Tax=Spirochaeta cellobiosiphila TaxID=504483 RepID=UPI0004220DF2|nr:PilZ domain-containing protein [Spirochaeta cellobiosiphila]
MGATIVLSQTNDHSLWSTLLPGRSLHNAQDLKQAFLYQINNPNIDSYIIDIDISFEKLLEMISYIHYLNGLVHVYIHINHLLGDITKNVSQLHVLEDVGELPRLLKDIPPDHRQYNRGHWPIQCEYWFPSQPDLRYEGMILSLSSGGCFIQTKDIHRDQVISMYVLFKDFRFLVEGRVLRRNSDTDQSSGIAVEFENVTPQTLKYIDEIINKKILSHLLVLLGEKEGDSEDS